MLINHDSVRAKISTLERRVPQAVRGAADILRHELNERFSMFLERLESVLEHFSADAHCSVAQVQLFVAQADFFLNQQAFRLALDEQLLASFAVGNNYQDIPSFVPPDFSWLASPFIPYEDSNLVESLGQWAAIQGVVGCNPFSPAALQQQMAIALGVALNEPRTALLIMEEYRQWLQRELPIVLLTVRDSLQAQGVELVLSNVSLKDVDTKEIQLCIDVHLAQVQDYMQSHTLYEAPEALVAHIIDALENTNKLTSVIGRVQQVFLQQRSIFWLHDCQRNAFWLLQIPAIKFAIDGHDFSHRDTHLFRYLLTLISEIGHGLPAAMLDNPRSHVYQTLHKAVYLAMGSRTDEPAGLIMAVDELLRLYSDSRMSTLLEVDKHSLRMLRAIGSGREVIRKARAIVAELDSTAMSQDALLFSLRDLIHAWSDVMLKTLLDHGEKSDEWAAVMTNLNHLAIVITDVRGDEAQQYAIQGIPDLIRNLRSGLEKQYSSLEMSRILGSLEAIPVQLHTATQRTTISPLPRQEVSDVVLPGEPGEWFHTGDSPKGIWQLLGSSAEGTILARGVDGALVEFPSTVIIDFLPQQDNIYRAVH